MSRKPVKKQLIEIRMWRRKKKKEKQKEKRKKKKEKVSE